MNAGKMFREGFLQLLQTFGGAVIIIKDLKEKITADVFVYFITYVNKVDLNGNRI